MSEIEAVTPALLVHPATGEAIDLADPLACLKALAEVRDLEDRLKTAKRYLSEVVAAEAARQGTKTLHLAGVTASISESNTIQWDMEVLTRLLDVGLPEERWNALVEETVSVKVKANVAKQIAGANPEYAKIIAEARHDFTGSPYVGKIEVHR